MRAVLQTLLIVASLASLVLPTANMVRPFVEQAPLAGVTETVTRPFLTLGGLLDESFQSTFTRWFDAGYGARPTLVRLDNTLAYRLFDEVRPDKAVRIGQDGVLFVHEHLWFWNSQKLYDFAREARRIRAAQDALRARGIELVVLTVPSKTSVWPEAVPRRWTTISLAERPTVPLVERAFPEELARAGALFVDGRKLLQDMAKTNREAVYPKGARHLARPGVCRIVEQALALVRPRLRDKSIPALDCSYDLVPDAPPESDDDDLHRLLNVWPSAAKPGATRMREVAPTDAPAREDGPEVLVIGSSFGWHVARELWRTRAVRDVKLYYYLARVFDWPVNTSSQVPFGSLESWRLLESCQLVLYVVPEEYFVDDKTPFWVETIRHYAPPTPENMELVQ